MPEDADEAGRLQKQHMVLKFNMQDNVQAPLKAGLEEGIFVLDSGCGPAAWTKEYPNSRSHSVDITATEFPDDRKPNNCEFQVANIAEHKPYPDNTLDFIYQRLLVMGLTSESWDNTLKEIFRVLKPGGYIELQEVRQINFSARTSIYNLFALFLWISTVKLRNTGPFIEQLYDTITNMLASRNIPADISLQLDDRTSKAGFAVQQITMTLMAINHKDKAGELLWEDYRHTYMNIRPIMAMQNPDWESVSAYKVHIDACGEEAKEKKTYLNWYTCVAQKPL